MISRKKIKSKTRTQSRVSSSIIKRTRKTLKKPENHFAELAPLIEICYIDNITGKKVKQKFPRGSRGKGKTDENSWVLLWNIPKKELWGVKRGRTKDITRDLQSQALDLAAKKTAAYKLYKDFNGWEEPNVSLTQLSKPFCWIDFGKAEHIVYHSDKFNKSDFYDYIHPFGDNGHIQIKDHGVKFYYDPNNKIFRLCGGKLTVNERGIVY